MDRAAGSSRRAFRLCKNTRSIRVRLPVDPPLMMCRCGHYLEEHTNHCCNGYVTDGQSDVGCYCSGFLEKTKEWEESQSKYYFKEYKFSLFEKIVRFFMEL